jgi:hypothetical protein
MKATIVNLSQWRTQDVEALYSAALTQSNVAEEPEFVLFVAHGWGRAAVDLSYHDNGVLAVSTPTRRIGPNGRYQTTPLETLACGREIDTGSFGQLAVSLRNALKDRRIDRLAPRNLPKWASNLTFVTRGTEDALKPKEWERLRGLIGKRFHASNLYVYNDEVFVTRADLPAVLRYARYTLARYTAAHRNNCQATVRRAREEWRKLRREDRARSKALDTLEELFHA